MHFCIVAKHCFPNGFSRFSKVAKTHHGTLIILMVFVYFEVVFRKMVPESFFSLRFYKVLGTCFSDVAKHCLTNGFLGLLGGPFGPLATRRGRGQRRARLETKGGGVLLGGGGGHGI